MEEVLTAPRSRVVGDLLVASGSRRLRVAATPLRTADGGAGPAVLWLVVDVSLAQRLAVAAARLQGTGGLRTWRWAQLAYDLDQLCDALGHEVRLVQDLLGRGRAEKARHLLDDVRRQLERVEELAQALRRDMSDLPGNDDERTDCARLVEETAEVIRAISMNEEIQVQVTAGAGVGSVRRTALEQVCFNLIMNGFDACTGTGGCLRVELDCRDEQLVMRFTDNGPGVSPELREEIFEPFYTTREGRLGLGLAVCRDIVTRMGGVIRCLAVPSGGACFEVMVPAAHVT